MRKEKLWKEKTTRGKRDLGEKGKRKLQEERETLERKERENYNRKNKMRKMIYPLTPEKMDKIYETKDEECRECKTNEHLKREYCSIGICVKEESENIGGER